MLRISYHTSPTLQNYLLVFLTEPDNSAEMVYSHFSLFSHCQRTCTTEMCCVGWPRHKAQGLLWVLKKCLWMQQQQLFRGAVLSVFINDAVTEIPSDSDTISRSHFTIPAWPPKNTRGFSIPKIEQISLVTLAATCVPIRREEIQRCTGTSGHNAENKSDRSFLV